MDTSCGDVDDVNSVDEISSTASTDEVEPTNSSVVVASTSSYPSSNTVSIGETRNMFSLSTISPALEKLPSGPVRPILVLEP